MMAEMNTLLEKWKRQLLDLGRQNRLIHHRETKRGSLRIVSPDLDIIYDQLIERRDCLIFNRSKESTKLYTKDRYEVPKNAPKNAPIADRKFGLELREAISIAKEVANTIEDKEKCHTIVSNRSDTQERHILKLLKDKAKTVMEEQGVHTLYLAFGFLKWNEENGDADFYSPLVLVPVSLHLETIHSDYSISYCEEEIVLNPTLCWKLEKENQILLPTCDFEQKNILEYLIEVNDFVSKYGWEVDLECDLSLFTYSKMKMYQDIEENTSRIKEHPILKAFGGDLSEIKTVSKELNNFNHDINSRPLDTYQVLDADASQQDAILYSKEGVSFVLQGPPGTGKSQTIANIIAEALARGKKVLFVSEKMAALEVVYKRLSEVGLAEFCLPLHSYKANKNEVLEEINQTLHMEKVKLYEKSLYQLDALQEHRKKLNQYASELHTECQPLGLSIYEVNGRLAKLYLRPNMEFRIHNVENKTSDELHQDMYLVSEYQKTLEKFGCPLEAHPWYQSKLTDSSYERKGEITANASLLQEKLGVLFETMNGIMEEYQIGAPVTFSGAYDLLHILKTARKAPRMSKEYLEAAKMGEALEVAKEQEQLQEEFVKLQEILSLMFQVDYEEIDANEAIHLLTEAMNSVREEINLNYFSTNNEIVMALEELLHVIEQEKSLLETSCRMQEKVEEQLGVPEAQTIEEMKAQATLLELLYLNPRPTIQWFDQSKWKSNYQKMLEMKQAMNELTRQQEEIMKEYDPDVVTINAEAMLYRFEYEYQSVYKMLKKEYRKDMELIRSFSLHHHEKLEEEEVISLLQKIISYQELYVWIGERSDWLKRFLGVYYDKTEIDWEVVEKEWFHFKKILDYYGGESIPPKVRELLLQGEGSNEELKQAYFALQSVIYPENIVRMESIVAVGQQVSVTPLKEVMNSLQVLYEKLYLVMQIYRLMNLSTNTSMPYSEGLSLLKKLKRYQQMEEELSTNQIKLKRMFPSLYQGIDTEWNQIIKNLVWLEEMGSLQAQLSISEEFVVQCMQHTNQESLKETMEYLMWCISDVTELFCWYRDMFEEPQEEKKLYLILDKVEQILNDDVLLEQWCNYVQAKEALLQHGLSEFVTEIEQMKSNPSIITEMYLKRFYQLWLDKMMPQFETVSNFQTSMLQDAREDFDKLDVSQFTIAQARIREKLIENLPDMDTSFFGEDEIAILKRELGKKHKLPLRKLFEQIPNLLVALKPCFMMSPLSVSLFLKADKFQFDLVIFDEASQIRTEDAVGAILRGSQVVIAGDAQQLPPTSFFAATKEEQFDSVLEEAQEILPERTLRWHYRSKHESLIAFSNAKIYNQNLITFPSTVENSSDTGVEYIYVEDGRYDRGGKKINVKEASKVAELIIEEATTRPGRSLGVITFSEAQQHEVERQLQELRLMHPELEPFFEESKSEPFFIKNLENVQGDERDTILFSIGYGKDEHDVLSMNFGPLSRSGGYKRLNVAITRAKYNIKLVGSFLPEEMRLENSTSDGVMMLYSYLQYARNRKEFLKKNEEVKREGNFTAPFEESIYEYLVSHNYKVETKVGCSGYRIDMAVMHPTKEGHYVLGIECDGATYHAARTVRERERLRQTVLKDMGWKIYRIWSTDWIKNPFIEGQKLIEAIEEAIEASNLIFCSKLDIINGNIVE